VVRAESIRGTHSEHGSPLAPRPSLRGVAGQSRTCFGFGSGERAQSPQRSDSILPHSSPPHRSSTRPHWSRISREGRVRRGARWQERGRDVHAWNLWSKPWRAWWWRHTWGHRKPCLERIGRPRHDQEHLEHWNELEQ
jgi:hypothetical protein